MKKENFGASLKAKSSESIRPSTLDFPTSNFAANWPFLGSVKLDYGLHHLN